MFIAASLLHPSGVCLSVCPVKLTHQGQAPNKLAMEQTGSPYLTACYSWFPMGQKWCKKNLAYEYAVKNGLRGFSVQKKTAGYHWFRGFLRHHSDLIMKNAENLSVPRAMSMNKEQVSKWFDTYQTLAINLGIIDLPTHIWNTDETGCQHIHMANRVVGVVGKLSYNLTAMEKGKTSTALITINAVGNSAPVIIVHKGKKCWQAAE